MGGFKRSSPGRHRRRRGETGSQEEVEGKKNYFATASWTEGGSIFSLSQKGTAHPDRRKIWNVGKAAPRGSQGDAGLVEPNRSTSPIEERMARASGLPWGRNSSLSQQKGSRKLSHKHQDRTENPKLLLVNILNLLAC